MILYISARRPQSIGSLGHIANSFLKFRVSKNTAFEDQENVAKNREKSRKIRGCTPGGTSSLRDCTLPTYQGGCQMSVRSGAGQPGPRTEPQIERSYHSHMLWTIRLAKQNRQSRHSKSASNKGASSENPILRLRSR